MSNEPSRLLYVYDGWNGYHRSLVSAVSDLTTDQLEFRGSAEMASVGEIAWHIGDGRVDWFNRMGAPGAAELYRRIEERNGRLMASAAIVDWLETTWQLVETTLAAWTVEDLSVSYKQPYKGVTYAVSRQWTIFRILAHDIHHGGQLSELLAMQGILPTDLTLLGGHVTEPPVSEPD